MASQLGASARIWVSEGPFISTVPGIEDVWTWQGYRLLVYNGGDIGDTSEVIAHTVFDLYPFDGVVIGTPYLGRDALKPFLRPGKDVFLGIDLDAEFGKLQTPDGGKVWEHILEGLI